MALTLAQVRTAVDDRLAALWPVLVARQNSYRSAKGRFFQGIRTVAVPPADGAEAAPDLTVKPHYQQENWSDFGLDLGATLPMQLEVHWYISPTGVGWVGICTVVYGGKTYQRARAVGPEQAARTFAWREITEVSL